MVNLYSMPAEKENLKIGQAAELLELEPYVLRFWESEFPQLRPLRTPKGQRLYTPEHIKILSRIKQLLYKDRLTIEGAKMRLAEEARMAGILQSIKDELQQIKNILKS
ncbi:MerR family transcriptional regulator [Desulfonatronospira sp.]|uniref:MerR family transcriptional regulator n=1 Tax=Desulfonatronospira sp. TaxID=1962951 RepID=UPI0025BDC545|nr:MerR family transcriptional regulator [Desulfonatronospira sp.]